MRHARETKEKRSRRLVNGRRARGGSRGSDSGGSGLVSNWKWFLLAAISVAFLGGAFWLMNALEEPPLDEALCPAGGPTAGAVIVLDLTDPVEASQIALIRQRIHSDIDDSAVGTLFAVGLVRPEADERGARIAVCKPLSGAEASELYENPRMIEDRYVSAFRKPLDAALSAMLSSGTADSSPIMESLQSTLADAPGFSDAAFPRRLILVTDLLQHSPTFSFYRGNSWRSFAESANFQRLARNLNGARVEIMRLPRPGARIGDWKDVDDFWVNYFEYQGAARVRISTIGDL